MPYIGNSPKNNVRGRFYYTATAAQTVFSGADSNGKTLAYQDGGYVDVYLNGVLLQDTTDYTATTKTSVTLTSGATAGDLVEIIAYGIFSVGDTVSAANGGTFKNNIDVVGTVTSDGLTVDGNSSITGDLTVDTDTLVVDAANNRVGIGTSSPSANLEITQSGNNVGLLVAGGGYNYTAKFESSDAEANIIIEDSNSTNDGNMIGVATNDMYFITNASEAMRIDNSQRLLVGKTSGGSISTFGNEISQTYAMHSRDDGVPLFVGRSGTSGDMIAFYNGTTSPSSHHGGIRTDGRIIIYDSLAGGIRFGATATNVMQLTPTSNTGTNLDNTHDIGASSVRWDDIYATNGTIQTSDRNEKQQIASLTDAEITAAKAISKLFKTFKWNDKVAEKGDAARTHAGVIAQDVQQAMTDAGLDAGNYAFFISNTWWETQTEVPAVAEELDEDGNVITEAAEAYTRTDTYDTLEEAPAGATERTRLGIRYPELLAFIGAATEQRLTSIEARLAALETA